MVPVNLGPEWVLTAWVWGFSALTWELGTCDLVLAEAKGKEMEPGSPSSWVRDWISG